MNTTTSGGADTIQTFFSQYKVITFKKNETILRAEATPQGVYYIKSGHVRLYLISEDGVEFTVIIYKAGDIIPLKWALNKVENIYYYEALSPVEVYCAPKNDFLDLMKKNAEAAMHITNQIVFDYSALIYRMQHIVFGNAQAKVASIILTAAKRFGEKNGKDISVPIRLTHQQIALSAGITRETASIEIKKFENKGFIGYDGRLMVIKDMEKLEKEAFL